MTGFWIICIKMSRITQKQQAKLTLLDNQLRMINFLPFKKLLKLFVYLWVFYPFAI
jgi:hypothetical protein